MPDNLLLCGDNLDMLRHHVRDESVELIYLDPPFKSNQDYNVLFKQQDGSRAAAQIQAFEDTWQWDSAAVAEFRQVVEAGGRVSEVLQALRMILGGTDMLAYLTRMAPRLVQLHRVLKLTGSIYLHCDPTASHYLKMLMDAIFGPERFLNEIVWKRTSAHSSAKRYGPTFDTILFYCKTDVYTWNPQYTPYDPQYVASNYKNKDADGRLWRKDNLTGAGVRRGPSGEPWRGYDPTAKGRHWACGTHEERERLVAEGKIGFSASGYPYLKRYLDEMPGVPLQAFWADIPLINNRAAEFLGYPTQKPEALLERIILSSSSEGETVLDPFCGCGTAVSVAHRLKRRWVGIDITYLALGLISQRLEDAFGKEVAKTYKVIGEPTVFEEALALADRDRHQFQSWAIYRAGGLPIPVDAKKGPDRGVDGRLFFHDENGNGPSKQVIYSVKSGANIGVRDVRDLRGVIDRDGAAIGVLITLHDPTPQMKMEAAEAGEYVSPWGSQRFLRLQILTVEGLFAGDQVLMPPRRETVAFKRAPKAKRQRPAQGKLFGQQGAG